MGIQKIPYMTAIYKGEGRFLVIPYITYKAGFRIHSEHAEVFPESVNSIELGECLLRCVEFIKNSPLDENTPQEINQRATWKKGTKYKSYLAFWKNNYYASLNVNELGEYDIHSEYRLVECKGGYAGTIKKVNLPPTATANEIGKLCLMFLKRRRSIIAKRKVIKRIRSKDSYDIAGIKRKELVW